MSNNENGGGIQRGVPDQTTQSELPLGRQMSSAESRDDSSGHDNRLTKNFVSRLTLNECLTLFVGLGTLFVSCLAYINATDTADLKHAVSNLSELASQTKRQADALNGQFAVIKGEERAINQQAGAAQISASEAKRSTDVAKSGIIAQNRPWITVSGIFHDRSRPLVAGQQFDYVVEIGNVGASPAENVSYAVNSRFIFVHNHVIDMRTIDGISSCHNTSRINSTDTIFPMHGRDIYQPHEGYLPPVIFPKPVTITQDMIDGNVALIVDGCLRYSFYGGVGQTKFCSAIQSTPSSPNGPGTVVSMACGKGNSAS